jgi:predicted nicotinamide N-methyase
MEPNQSASPESLPETPLEALRGVVRDAVIVAGQTFRIERPDDSDLLLEHPAVRSAFVADDYLPYWADLWPAARMLAAAILRETWPPNLRALEIGCGLGLPGIAALSVGIPVTFSDYDATALRFAAANARLNGFTDFETLRLDWRSPPQGLRFPLILASDLVYELRNVDPLVHALRKLLGPGGLCLLTDQDRVPSQQLRQKLAEEGFAFTSQAAKAGEPGGRRVRGTLYRITHAG